MSSFNKLFKEIYANKMKELLLDGILIFSNYSVEDWLNRNITEKDMENYPNAKKAAELKNTKLYKALK